jgi:hypothetical protein
MGVADEDVSAATGDVWHRSRVIIYGPLMPGDLFR